MKQTILPIAAVAVAACLLSCDEKGKKTDATPASATETENAAKDTPILPVKPGDSWTYGVTLAIPQNITSEGASEVNTKFTRTRTYLGKIAAADGLPVTDCFEVVVPGSPREREFVEIQDDRILMRGSLILRPETTKPMWFDPPVPFVWAGMKPGSSLPELKAGDGSLVRNTQVIAREEIKVQAGSFQCVRILTTGSDGDIELRLTRWFSPGNGIIREEKARYRLDKLIYRETQELREIKRMP